MHSDVVQPGTYRSNYRQCRKYLTIETEPKPAMPEHCKIPGDAVGSYRKYYIMEKRRFATWKSPAKIPEWYQEGVKQYA